MVPQPSSKNPSSNPNPKSLICLYPAAPSSRFVHGPPIRCCWSVRREDGYLEHLWQQKEGDFASLHLLALTSYHGVQTMREDTLMLLIAIFVFLSELLRLMCIKYEWQGFGALLKQKSRRDHSALNDVF